MSIDHWIGRAAKSIRSGAEPCPLDSNAAFGHQAVHIGFGSIGDGDLFEGLTEQLAQAVYQLPA